mmetsp:Transcript_40850/g.80156  ORF Transcript_40850/g.80156 Transcript_40850/m.80156 type:complete len:216 (+) Transcript_40850:945-1592(+)
MAIFALVSKFALSFGVIRAEGYRFGCAAAVAAICALDNLGFASSARTSTCFPLFSDILIWLLGVAHHTLHPCILTQAKATLPFRAPWAFRKTRRAQFLCRRVADMTPTTLPGLGRLGAARVFQGKDILRKILLNRIFMRAPSLRQAISLPGVHSLFKGFTGQSLNRSGGQEAIPCTSSFQLQNFTDVHLRNHPVSATNKVIFVCFSQDGSSVGGE